MKTNFIKYGLLGMAFLSMGNVMAQQINPMTEAVIRNYSDILAENPKDYLTLYDRATQYLSIGDFTRALSDVEMALEYTPDKDVDYKVAEYSLKSDILSSQKDYQGALAALNEALKINASAQTELYKLGNIYLLTNQPKEALQAFQRLQRENTRSQEAFYGMAKANALLGNTEEAVNLINQIETLGKQSFVTYCRIGDLYVDMNKLPEATSNYMIAYAMADSSTRPIESLKFLVKKNPAVVMDAIDKNIEANPDNVTLNYVKAIVAYDGGLYDKVEKACKDLAKGLEKDSPAVYRMMALSQLALDKREEAKQSIATAEGLEPNSNGILIDKAMIFMHDDPAKANEFAEKALIAHPDDEETLLLAAKSAMLSGKYKEAQAHLGNIILSDPSNIEALLLRGYLNSDLLKDGKAGVADYTRAGNVKTDDPYQMALSALGKAKIGKRLDSEGIIGDAIAKAGNNKDNLYIIAVYYAQTGNLEKAKEFADKAVANGYSNIYNLKSNNEPLLNLSPIHHLMK